MIQTPADADLDNERNLLIQLNESPGWKLCVSKWQRVLDECTKELKSQSTENREWYAGLVTGYERILQYPDARIATLTATLLKHDKKAA